MDAKEVADEDLPSGVKLHILPTEETTDLSGEKIQKKNSLGHQRPDFTSELQKLIAPLPFDSEEGKFAVSVPEMMVGAIEALAKKFELKVTRFK